jgi:hypothetical protein
MYHDRPHQAQRIDGQMPFAARDLLSGIVASFFAPFGCADRLAVDDRRRGCAPFADTASQPPAQHIVNPFPDFGFPPSPEDRVHGLPFGKVGRQLPPLTASPHNIQHGVNDSPAVDRRPATLGPRG